MVYGSEAWTLRRREEERLERTEMRMLRWILGLTLEDRKRNDDIRRVIGVACITDKVREARLRWYGHIQRREEDDGVKRILEADVHGQRSRGRQRKRWTDVVKYNMEDLWLTLEDTGNRAEWRRITHVADPSLYIFSYSAFELQVCLINSVVSCQLSVSKNCLSSVYSLISSTDI